MCRTDYNGISQLQSNLFKYYENLGIRYILYCLDIHQKELKSIQPLFLNPGTQLLFVSRSTPPSIMKLLQADLEKAAWWVFIYYPHPPLHKGYAKKKSATRGCFIWLRPPRHPPLPHAS